MPHSTIQSKADLDAFLRADFAMLHIDRWRVRYRLTNPIVHYQRLLRVAEYRQNTAKTQLARVIAQASWLRAKRAGHRLGYSIPRNVFGPGLSIAHVGTIVVNGKCRVGSNCRIAHCVTLGESEGRAPEIGDDVHIAPHVAVIGGVRVGDSCGLWVGAVVTSDVPDHCDAAGVPARVVRTDTPPWVDKWLAGDGATSSAPRGGHATSFRVRRQDRRARAQRR